MGKNNGCLKCVFIIFNLLFAIIGGLLIWYLAISSHQFSWVLVLSWVVSIAILGISFLGICAACSENICALKTFAGFMGAGMIIMLICGFIVVAIGNQRKEAFNSSREHTSGTMEDVQMQELLKDLQKTGKCCGFMGAEDWGYNIPESCACNGSSKCTSRPSGTTGPDQIYAQGCSEILLQYVDIGFNIIMDICFGFSAIALLGMLISLFMIHQIKRHDSPAGEYSMAMNDVQRGAV